MGHELQNLCQFEPRRLVWLIGIVLSIALVTQYFELPYGNVITSGFSAGEPQLLGIGAFSPIDSSNNPKLSGNTTTFTGLNSASTDYFLNNDNPTKTPEGEDRGPMNDSVAEKNGGSDDSIEFDADRNPEAESPSENFVELNHNSTLDIPVADNSLPPEKVIESAYSFHPNNAATDSNSSLGSFPDIDNMTKASEGEDRGLLNDFVPEKNKGSDDSIELEADRDLVDESPSEDFVELNHNSTVDIKVSDNSLAPEKARESGYSFAPNNAATDSNSSLGGKESNALTELKNGSISATPATSSLALPPIISVISLPNSNSPKNVDINSDSPMNFGYPNTSSVDTDTGNTIPLDENFEGLQTHSVMPENSSSKTNVSAVKVGSEPTPAVISISEMNDLLLQNRASSFSTEPLWSSAVDQELRNAKLQIGNAHIIDNDPWLYAPLYRNVSVFKRSYELMEQKLKVYIYKEGERPIFHTPVLKGIYASEGWFMKLLKANKNFVTKNPGKAHLFYLPFSSRILEEALYVPDSHNRKNLVQHLKNYLDVIAARYSFWNRTGGADHFLVACHDWAPSETNQHMGNCMRALCNSDIKEGFGLGKDVSLPETNVRTPQNPLRQLGGKPPSQRRILAFFAGNMHGYLRPILLQHWENKDPDMKIFGPMRNKVKGMMNYVRHMKSSKYCICAKGYEVNSPRVVEAIFYECVPVILSDNFVPPFFEILNWESFSVFVPEKDIPNLKSILMSIPEKKYLEMQYRVKKLSCVCECVRAHALQTVF